MSPCFPIGDNFTMGVDDAAKAVEFLQPRLAVPMHYGTFEIIEVDPKEFCREGLPTRTTRGDPEDRPVAGILSRWEKA